MITISTHWDVVCITTIHITATVTVRVVRYIDVMGTTECRAVGGITANSILVVLDYGVLSLLVNGEQERLGVVLRSIT